LNNIASAAEALFDFLIIWDCNWTKKSSSNAKRSRAFLISKLFLGKYSGEFYADYNSCSRVAKTIEKLQPEAVFTLWPIDRHPDHSAVAETAQKAIALAGIELELIFFEAGMNSQTAHFEPDFYVDISQITSEKEELIRCHKSQCRNGALVKRFLAQNKLRGQSIKVPYAEGFKVLHRFKKRPVDLQIPSLPDFDCATTSVLSKLNQFIH